MMDPSRSPYADHALAFVRIVAGVVFVSVGSMKVFGYPPSPGPAVSLLTLVGVGGIIEVTGGILIVLGLFTRPAAFVLSGEMAVAYFQFHAPLSLFPTMNNGMPAILYCLLFFYLVFAGPGAWSLDRLLAARSRRR